MRALTAMFFSSLAGFCVLYSTGIFASEASFDKECPRNSNYVCKIPIYALYGNLQMFIDRNISVAGFVRRVGENYLLFPDQGIAKFAIAAQAVFLIDENEEFRTRLETSNQTYVQVIGKVLEPGSSQYWVSLRLEKPPQLLPVVPND